MALSRGEAVHATAALVCCLILPAFSRIAGEGGLAWTMFSSSAAFRLELRVTDETGAVHYLHPAELAAHTEPSLGFYLRGADRFHTWPVGPTFLGRLPALAALACKLGPYRAIELTLEQRSTLDAPVRRTHAGSVCPRG